MSVLKQIPININTTKIVTVIAINFVVIKFDRLSFIIVSCVGGVVVVVVDGVDKDG